MKGGTTILYGYICTHPRVAPSLQKEVHYFSMYPTRDIEWYKEQFPARPDDVFAVDASPTYFDIATMPTIPAYIKREVPHARVILIVRDPVERAISHFQHIRTIVSKEAFSDIDVNEFFSRPLERCYTLGDPTDWQFRHVLGFSLYDEKFDNYVRVFGRENILVITNEALRTEPQATMRRVFEHCGLEWAPSAMFGVQDYMSGSETLVIDRKVRERLEALFYPSYERFRRRAGLPRMTARAAASSTVAATVPTRGADPAPALLGRKS
jgi:hypothetical protein